MTDHPRFEPVKGEPDVAHQAYYGGALVSLVLRLFDRWRGRPQKITTRTLSIRPAAWW